MVECDRGGAGPLPKPYLPPPPPPSIPRLSLAYRPLFILIKNPLLPSLIPSVVFDSILRFAQNTHILRSSQSLITPPPHHYYYINNNQTPQQTCVSKLPFSPLRPPSLSPAPRISLRFLNALYVHLYLVVLILFSSTSRGTIGIASS